MRKKNRFFLYSVLLQKIISIMSELDKFIEQYGNEESNTIQSVVDVMENGTFQEKSDKINDHFQYTADYYREYGVEEPSYFLHVRRSLP